MKHPKVEIYKHFKSADPPTTGEDEWGWRLKAANGEIVASGEGHGSPRDAERAFRDAAATMLMLVHNSLEFGANWRIEVVDD